MLQAGSWAGISCHIDTSSALPSCPRQLAFLAEISYHKDKWLLDSLLREWVKERRVLTPKVFSVHLLSSVSAHVNERHQILGTCWSPSSFEEVKPVAWCTWMLGTFPARAGGEG